MVSKCISVSILLYVQLLSEGHKTATAAAHLSNETKYRSCETGPSQSLVGLGYETRFLFPSPIFLISQIATSQQNGARDRKVTDCGLSRPYF